MNPSSLPTANDPSTAIPRRLRLRAARQSGEATEGALAPDLSPPNDLPMISWRLATPQDLPECLQMCPPEAFGAQLPGHDTLLHLWARMINGSPATTSTMVFETDRPVHGSRLAGFGSAAFVTESFAGDNIANPRPGLNLRFLQALHEGRSPLLTPAALRRHNTIGGLNLITLAGYIRPACEDSPALMQEISMTISKAFQQCYLGFRLRHFLFEVTHQTLRQRPHKLSIYPIHPYPQPLPASSPIGVIILDRATALLREDSAFAQLFQYREPCLRLSPKEQELLQVAQRGQPDAGQADELGLGEEAVRSRWRTSLRKSGPLLRQIMPAVRPAAVARGANGHGASAAAESGTPPRRRCPPRGKQRRQYLINYVREHPEELRPFDWTLWDSVHGRTTSPRR
jgi:PAS domain-containing protein